MRINLFWRVLLFLLIIIGIISFLLKFWFEPALYNSYSLQELNYATSLAKFSSSTLAAEFRVGCSLNKIEGLNKDLSVKTGKQVIIIVPNCINSELSNINLNLYRNQPDLYNTLSGKSTAYLKSSNISRTITLFSAEPILLDKNIIGAIQIESSINSLPNDISEYFNQLYLILLLLSFFSIFFSFFLYRYYSKKLWKASTDLFELSDTKGGLQTKVHPFSINEMEQLENSIKHSIIEIRKIISTNSSDVRVFTSILNNMNDGILVIDPNGLVKLINTAAANLFSIEIHQAETHSLVEVIRNHVIEELWKKSIETQKIQTIDTEIGTQHLYVRCIATPLAPQLPDSLLLLFQDLTRIHQLEIIRQDFVSNVSHELRTPLASLKALVETLQDNALDDPEVANKFLERMDNEIDSLTQMVQELLELSKIESGRVPLEKRETAPIDLVKKAAERMQPQIQRAKLNLMIDVQQKMPTILVDVNRMEQVFINLIHNAIKFTPPGGIITLDAIRQNHEIVFSVKDTGVGIPPRDLERIFERFYKVNRARSDHGTGLGLSIARHLVEAHGGKIWVESISTKGSTFFFSIPIKKE